MLQRTESEETSAAERLAAISPVTSEAAKQEGLPATHSAAETAQWIACIEAGIARSKKRSKIIWWGNGFHYTLVSIVLLVFGSLLKNHFHSFSSLAIIFYINFFVNVLNDVIRKYWSQVQRPAERTAARQLAAMDDPALIGILIDALYWTDEETLQIQLRQTLGRLLPRLTEEQVRDLGRERHGILAAWMQQWDANSAESNTLLVAILHSLAVVGREKVETETRRQGKTTLSLIPILKPWTLGKKAGQDPTV